MLFLVVTIGIEPISEAPETSILSIELRDQRICAANVRDTSLKMKISELKIINEKY